MSGDIPENAASLAATAFGWWRRDVPSEECYRYWRDVHGPLAARIPGLFQYRQRHLNPIVPGEWPAIDGVQMGLPLDQQPQGSAELLFLTPEDQASFGTSPLVTEYVFNDERNLVRRNVTYAVSEGNCRTLIDQTGCPTPQGGMPNPGWMVCLQRAHGVDDESFREYLREQLALAWGQLPGVRRVRLSLLEPYDETGWRSPGVRHDWSPEHQHQAWIDLVVSDRSVLRDLAETAGITDHVRALNPFPVAEQYTLVFGGQPTAVGLRGWPAVQTIDAVGADNQRDADLLEAMYGPVVYGAKALPRNAA